MYFGIYRINIFQEIFFLIVIIRTEMGFFIRF